MTRVEILIMLRQLFRTAVIMQTASDDPSGLATKYLVDQEQLMANLESAIEEEGAGK